MERTVAETAGTGRTVLFCGPIDNPLNSGRYMVAALERLGYRVLSYDYRSNPRFEEELPAIAESGNPEFLFTYKGEKLSPPLINTLKSRGAWAILWYLDIPVEEWAVPLARAHDCVCTNVEGHLARFRQAGVANVKWVHQGFAPEFFGIAGPGGGYGGGGADVALIGSMGAPLYRRRCELVMRLRREGIDVRWWGPRLSRQVKNLRYFLGGVHRAWAGREVFMKDFASVIGTTKVFLGEDADISVTGRYLSNRCFAVMGCGGFYLCRRTPGVEHAFTVGEEIDVFDGDDEMVEKVRYYLAHDDERRRIAGAGQRRVLAEYTYEKQMKRIFDWVGTCRKKGP